MIPVGESGVESVDPVIQPADPFDTDSLKVNNAGDEAVPENSHDLQAEGEAIIAPQPLGKPSQLVLYACSLIAWTFGIVGFELGFD